jgi:branched-chain amino acid transport system substrate-binding protein
MVPILGTPSAADALYPDGADRPAGQGRREPAVRIREKTMNQTRRQLLTTMGGAALVLPRGARAQKKYDPGASDTEIRIGNTTAYSGPDSPGGTVFGRCFTAFFKMINAEGGINGRRINFISYDDAYSPPKTVEQTRKLVESDRVLFIFSGTGTPTQSAVLNYMNENKVPQLFAHSGASKFADPKNFPWTMPFQQNYEAVGRIYAQYILANHPGSKIGVLYQNDGLGKSYLKGLRDGLGAKAGSTILMAAPYETSDPTVDSQIVSLKSSGADLFYNVSINKFAAQAIRKAAEIGWKPLQLLDPANSVALTLRPAGLENCKGVISTFWLKDPTDPTWKNDAGYKEWLAFMDKWYPQGDKTEGSYARAYTAAQTLVHVLKECGGDLTRANIMKQAANIHDLALPMLLPGITINTSPTDFRPIKQAQMARFNGERWVLFGSVLTA